MKTQPKKKQTQDDMLQEKIEKLLSILNSPETLCTFWKINEPHAHLMGIRPVKRTTIEIINPNGFNPYDKKTEENLFKCFKIFVENNKKHYLTIEEKFKIRNELEKNGIIYISHYDLISILEIIRKSL